MKIGESLILGASLFAVAVPSQARYFSVGSGAFYDTGDFGTSRDFHTWYFPVTVKGVWDRFDLSLTSAWVYLSTEQRLALAEGTPNPSGQPQSTTTSGPNDTVLRSRYFWIKDPGPDTWRPGITPYAKVKLPTGDPDKELGTGKPDFGAGLSFDKTFEPIFFFIDGGYTIVGKPAGENLQNRPSATGGVGASLNKKTSLSTELDWQRALVKGFDDPFDVMLIASRKLTRSVQIDVYALKGLSNGSPKFGGGMDASYKFGFR